VTMDIYKVIRNTKFGFSSDDRQNLQERGVRAGAEIDTELHPVLKANYTI